MGDLITRPRLWVRWFKRVEAGSVQEKEKLNDLEKKCINTENEMKIKIEELDETISNLRTVISSLEEKISKEESERKEAIDCYRKEQEARSAAERMQASVSTELEKVREEKSAAERKAISNEDLYKQSQEYNMSLRHYSSCLISDLKTSNEAHKQLIASVKGTCLQYQINMLQQQLIAEMEKLKMADLSVSETRTVIEDQKRIICELQERLAEKESQVIEGEMLRKKLHNTILVIFFFGLVCIFSYGQTGSEKTYTMTGRPDAPNLKGLIPRSLEQIFHISQSMKDQGWKYQMQKYIMRP